MSAPSRAVVLGGGGVLGFAWMLGALAALESEADSRPALGPRRRRHLRRVGRRGTARLRPVGRGHLAPPPGHPRPRGPADRLRLRRRGGQRRAAPAELAAGVAAAGVGRAASPAPGVAGRRAHRAAAAGSRVARTRACARRGRRPRDRPCRRRGPRRRGRGSSPPTTAPGGASCSAATTCRRCRTGVPGTCARPRSPTAVQASCSIPAWYPPTVIDGVPYVDGGAVSICSVDVVQRLPVDEVFVLAPMASTEPDSPRTTVARLERRLRRLVTRRDAGRRRAAAQHRQAGLRDHPGCRRPRGDGREHDEPAHGAPRCSSRPGASAAAQLRRELDPSAGWGRRSGSATA